MPFDPTAAVIVHSLVTLNPAVITSLQAEEFLLVESVSYEGSRQEDRYLGIDGNPILIVESDPRINITVNAKVLDNQGLADYHPGRKLSAQALTFANGIDLPFQFREDKAVYIYRSPRLTRTQGDLPDLQFTIGVELSDLDLVNYPPSVVGGDSGPGGGSVPPIDYVEIPVQNEIASNEFELSHAVKAAVLLEYFNGISAFGPTAKLTAALWAGNPDEDGVQVGNAIEMVNGWQDYSEPVLAWRTEARNENVITWPQAFTYSNTITHIRYERNGIIVATTKLNAPLEVQAYRAVRAPVAALAVYLKWPLGAPDASTAADGGRLVMGHIMGGVTSIVGSIYVIAGDATYPAAGTGGVLTEFECAATDVFWQVTTSGTTLQVKPVAVTSPATAPPGGWAVESVQYWLYNSSFGPMAPLLMRRLHSQAVAEAANLILHDTPIVDLNETPV